MSSGLALLWLGEVGRELSLCWEQPLPQRAAAVALAAPSPDSLVLFLGTSAFLVRATGLSGPVALGAEVVGAEAGTGRGTVLVSTADGRLAETRLEWGTVVLDLLEADFLSSGGPLPFARELHRLQGGLCLGVHPDFGCQLIRVGPAPDCTPADHPTLLTGLGLIRQSVNCDSDGSLESFCLCSDGRADVVSRCAIGVRLKPALTIHVETAHQYTRTFLAKCSTNRLVLLLSSQTGGSSVLTVSSGSWSEGQCSHLDDFPTLLWSTFNSEICRVTARRIQTFSTELEPRLNITSVDLLGCEEPINLAAGTADYLFVCTSSCLFVLSFNGKFTLQLMHHLSSAKSIVATSISPATSILSIIFWNSSHRILIHRKDLNEIREISPSGFTQDAVHEHCLAKIGDKESKTSWIILGKRRNISIIRIAYGDEPQNVLLETQESISLQNCERLISNENGSFFALANGRVQFFNNVGGRWNRTPLLSNRKINADSVAICSDVPASIAWIGDQSLHVSRLTEDFPRWELNIVKCAYLDRRVKWLQPLNLFNSTHFIVYSEDENIFRLTLYYGESCQAHDWNVPEPVLAMSDGVQPSHDLCEEDSDQAFFCICLKSSDACVSELIMYSLCLGEERVPEIVPVASLSIDGKVFCTVKLNDRFLCAICDRGAIVCGWTECDPLVEEEAISFAELCSASLDLKVGRNICLQTVLSTHS